MTAVFFLVRHAAHRELGQRLTGRDDGAPLSEAGERQARAVGERLGRERLAAIHTSPRARARATAEAIARRTDLPVTVAAALDEIDFGEWTGARYEALEQDPRWRQWNAARAEARAPRGESMAAAADRIMGHIEGAARAHSGWAVALISHCDMIRAAIARVLGLSLDNILRFEVDPASISTIEVGDWGARVLGINEKAAT